MPIVVKEKIGRSGTSGLNSSGELPFLVTGTNNLVDAKAALLAYVNATYPTFDDNPLAEVSVEEVYEKSAVDGIWDGFARYQSKEGVIFDVGESTYSFTTAGGTQHITHSKATRKVYDEAGVSTVSFGGAIGVTDDSIEGCDIVVPIYEFEETHVFNNDQITAAYKGTLIQLTGKVNNAAFKGLAIGECLFLGASGGKRGSGKWELTFRFQGSPNATASLLYGSITVANSVPGIAKYGWDYIWVRYKEYSDTTNQKIVVKPNFAIVERVYDQANFASIGIGTT